MIYIGIDPGLTGAIATIDNDFIQVEDIPVMAKGKGRSKVKNQINPSGVKSILTNATFSGKEVIVFLERLSSMPGQGVSSVFSLGDTFGCIRGVCAALNIPVEIITPQSWKKYYKLGSDKEIVRAKAIELFPEMPLSRKKDHNRAESLLIANYGMRSLTMVQTLKMAGGI